MNSVNQVIQLCVTSRIRFAIINQMLVIISLFVLHCGCILCNMATSSWSTSHTKAIPAWQRPPEGFATRQYPKFTNEPLIIPAPKKQTSTIIFLHGHGQTAQDWSEILKKFPQVYMKMIMPTANIIPVSWYNGTAMPSWFDFGGDKYPHYNIDSVNGIKASCDYVHHLIDDEIRNGIPAKRIIVGGYSQGGVIALHAALSYPQKLGGIFTSSTWAPSRNFLITNFRSTNRHIDIGQYRVDGDPFTPFISGPLTYNFLRSHISINTIFKKYPGNDSITLHEFHDMRFFTRRIVPPLDDPTTPSYEESNKIE